MNLSNSTKRSVAFFLVVLCGVSLLNCMSNREPQADQDSISRAEQREREFIEPLRGNHPSLGGGGNGGFFLNKVK